MHIHILGICGTFMGGLAALAREAGHRVTGCDAGVYPPMSDQLRSLGIELIEGFAAEQLALKPDVFVVGNVVSRAHGADGAPKYPLMEAILDAGLPYTSGPQWLAEHVLRTPAAGSSAVRHVLAVAGTHGKTTTSSMLAWVLEHAGLQPGFLIGGVPQNFGVSARLGQGHCFVIEADEYDTAFFDKRSKFVHYRPRTALLNNLEFDHADIFDDLPAIERQFHHLVRTVPPSGLVVSNAQEAALERVLGMGCWSPVARFGGGGDLQAHGPAHDFEVRSKSGETGQVVWGQSGDHNRLNALAAIAAAAHVGVGLAVACEALSLFQSPKRRMELRGTVRGISVIDDFAHHPTAMRTTIDGLRAQMQAKGQTGRILAAFEPRSATMKLGTMKSQLPWALENADCIYCHAAHLGWDAGEALSAYPKPQLVAGNVAAIVQAIAREAVSGDRVLVMSNGGFGGIHQLLLDALGRDEDAKN